MLTAMASGHFTWIPHLFLLQVKSPVKSFWSWRGASQDNLETTVAPCLMLSLFPEPGSHSLRLSGCESSWSTIVQDCRFGVSGGGTPISRNTPWVLLCVKQDVQPGPSYFSHTHPCLLPLLRSPWKVRCLDMTWRWPYPFTWTACVLLSLEW